MYKTTSFLSYARGSETPPNQYTTEDFGEEERFRPRAKIQLGSERLSRRPKTPPARKITVTMVVIIMTIIAAYWLYRM